MGMEKKSGGFLHVFDWNRKSRKKLFSESPEHLKQMKKKDDNLPGTFLNLNEDEEIPRAPRGKDDFSCSSSVTDEECGSSRAPGVIAKLMGLDSLPVSGISAPHSTPLFEDSWKCRENHLSENIREFNPSNQFHNIVGNTSTELRSQKIPSSPIEKFQSEPLPPRSAKSLQITCNRLLSPVKNPRFVFVNNAAHVMEAAAKIIEPGLQSGLKSRPSSNLLKVSSNLRERESSQRSAGSVADKSNKSRNLDGSDRVASICRPSSSNSRIENNSNINGEKVKGRSISLAVQAKVNVRRREGLLSGNGDVSIHIDEDDNSPRSSQINQKQKQQRKSSGSNSSVLKQNNQKQNSSLGKDRSASKYEKSKSSKALYSKERCLTSTKNLPKKKRLFESDNHMIESESDSTLISRDSKWAQQNDSMEVSHWREHSRGNGADVVSFTFATPIIKPDTGDIKKRFSLDSRQNLPEEKSRMLQCHESNMFSGDVLSRLLEQKLRELTSVLDPSLASSTSATNDDSKSDADAFTANITGQKRENRYTRSDDNVIHDSSNSTSNIMSELSRKLQKLDAVDCSSSIGNSKEEEHQDLSPLSIFDATFSSESCDTSASLGSSGGSKNNCSSVHAQVPLDNNQLDLLDSASSTCRGSVDEENDLNYIRKILINTEPKHALGEIMEPELFKCEGDKENSRLRRRVLFGCVKELLIEKRKLYFESGYRAWAKGKAIAGSKLAEGLHKKILAWECMAGWTVDELVDEDMSSPLGRWIDFEVEKFESGMEIEDDLISSLIEEVVSDILVVG